MLGCRGRGRRRERGTALVEFALVMPLFLLITGGVIDYGLAYRVKQSVETASRNAARVGAAASDDQMIPYADLFILRSVYESLSSDSNTRNLLAGDLTSSNATAFRVIVFDPDANGQMKPGCSSGAPIANARCNIYTLADVQQSVQFFDATGNPIRTGGSASNYLNSTLYTNKANCASTCYRPTDRQVGQFDAAGARVFSDVGVTINLDRQQFFANVLPVDSASVGAKAVFAMEYGATDRPFVPEPVATVPTTTSSTVPAASTTTRAASTTTTTRAGSGGTTTTTRRPSTTTTTVWWPPTTSAPTTTTTRATIPRGVGGNGG